MTQPRADRPSDAGERMLEAIRANPVPAAMVGVGLGWLLWNRGRGAASSRRSRAPSRGWLAGGNVYTGASHAHGYAGYPAPGSGGYRGSYAAGADAQAGDRGVVDALRGRVGALAHRAEQAAGDLVHRTPWVRERPLAVVAATLTD